MIITATEYQARVLRAAGQSAFAFGAWGERQLKQHHIAGMGSFEEQALWFELVKDVPISNKAALVAACMDTFKTMMLYGIPPARLNTFDQENIVLFRELLQRFLAQGKPTVWQALQGLSSIHQSAELFGFIDFPPLYQHLLRHPDIAAGDRQDSGLKMKAFVLEASNPEAEFLTALTEIEHMGQQHPHKKFALVVQQSALSWRTIHRLLKIRPSPLKISCSKGEALRDQPKFQFIKDLFATLTSTDLMRMSRVLTSAFWQEDLQRRLDLDRYLRGHSLRVNTLPQMLKTLVYHAPDIQEMRWFQAWSTLANFDQTEAQAFIDTFLQAAAWIDLPADRVQQVNLHIVGVLEAVDLPVDTVWLLSADSKHYPAAKKNPVFLPKVLLAEYGVPLSVEARYQFAERVLQRMTAQKEVYASFVASEKGEKQTLSQLITPLSFPRRRESRCQEPAPGIPASAGMTDIRVKCSPAAAVKGGSRLLKEQAECPFQAFAHFRLDVSALPAGQDLLDPKQKGLLVHAVLEKIWTSLKSQQQLLDLSEPERNQRIVQKVEEALRQINTPARRGLIRQLEKQRLIRIMQEWLQLEIARPPFRVLACEAKEIIAVGGVQFRLRLDRIDEIAEGQLVIDYKTGEVSNKGWFEERLREPQLPLYALAHQAAGLSFASLKVGKMGFVSVFPDAAQNAKWQTQLEALTAEFQQGRADVAPIDAKVCLYCDLSSFCRIKEL